MKYSIEITETLQKTITVGADSPEQAMGKVRDAYHDGSIVLDADDKVGDTTFCQTFGRKDKQRPAGSTRRNERVR